MSRWSSTIISFVSWFLMFIDDNDNDDDGENEHNENNNYNENFPMEELSLICVR
jgi:hypothetical protein